MSPRSSQTVQQQQDAILAAAAQAISESSLLDFKMASIAKLAGVSMGTVYKHVQSKEDVLVALATASFDHQCQKFGQILTLPWTTPERLISLFLISAPRVARYDFGAHLEMMITNKAILDRASQAWLERMYRADDSITTLFRQTMADAVAAGELGDAYTASQSRQLMLGLWALEAGFQWVTYQQKTRQPQDIEAATDPPPSDHPVVVSAQQMINQHPWRQKLDDEHIQAVCQRLADAGFR